MRTIGSCLTGEWVLVSPYKKAKPANFTSKGEIVRQMPCPGHTLSMAKRVMAGALCIFKSDICGGTYDRTSNKRILRIRDSLQADFA